MKNKFNETLKTYIGETSINAAWREALDLKHSAFAGDYRAVAPENLANFVRSAVCNPDEYGLCSVLRNIRMPADASADMRYHTSYVVAAAGIYLMVYYPESLNASELNALSRMMDAAFKDGIIIHGYDDENVESKIVAMFGMAGGQKLIDTYPDFCPAFTVVAKQYLNMCYKVAWEGNPAGAHVRSGGFNPELQNISRRWVLASWQGKPHAVFTYGTLMKGQRAEHLMESAFWGGNCCLNGYAMYNLGHFPGIKKKEAECTLGELWFVSDETLAALDRYEGEGSLYLRKRVTISSAYGSLTANAYIYRHTPAGDILRQKWGSTTDEYVWYAAYGSNLSAERFACYIQGGTCKENGRTYTGCDDKRLWTHECFTTVNGRMYFGRESRTWGGGVAFFNANGYGASVVRLYRITKAQLIGVMKQECDSPEWYGHLQCLGTKENGEPIYTLTSGKVHKPNKPAKAYMQLIKSALVSEAGLSENDAVRYLDDCMQ